MSAAKATQQSKMWNKTMLIAAVFLTCVMLWGVALITFGDVLAGL